MAGRLFLTGVANKFADILNSGFIPNPFFIGDLLLGVASKLVAIADKGLFPKPLFLLRLYVRGVLAFARFGDLLFDL